MSPKKVQVATSLDFCWENTCLCGYCLVSLYDTTVLPLVIDCKSARIYIANKGGIVQAVVWLFRPLLHVIYWIVRHNINHMDKYYALPSTLSEDVFSTR